MTSKVLVKLPVVPFSQLGEKKSGIFEPDTVKSSLRTKGIKRATLEHVFATKRKKPPPEIISLPSRNEESDEGRFQGHVSDKVTQLEQNMKFLQDQHQATLVALHQEVEVLRQRNRDLQFQLVFSKGTNYTPSSPSSPEDSGNGFAKPKGSPASVNVAPLQVELLEKDLQDIKTSLNEAKTRNIYLSEVVEKQKKALELSEKSKEKQKVTDVGIQVDSLLECTQVELQARLDDAEALVKRLRQENEDQRKEIATLKSANTYSNGNSNRSGSSRSRGGQNAYHNRGNSSNEVQTQEENYHKFPPLQTKSWWHRASRGNHSYDHNSQSDYHRNSRHHQQQDRQQELEPDVDNTVLPQLRNGSVRVDNSSSFPPFYRSVGHHSGGGGNYYKDERGNRKYRGQKSQRDMRRDQDTREYHREYKDREPKDNQRQQQQFSESSKGARRQ